MFSDHRDDGFGRRRAVAQGTMSFLRIVVFPLIFNDDLRLLQGVEECIV